MNGRSGMSVRLAAALNYPIDAIANCKDGKSNASDRSWRPPIRSLAAVGLAWVGGEIKAASHYRGSSKENRENPSE